MKCSIILSLCLLSTVGCVKQQTLVEREAAQKRTKVEFLKAYPSFEIQRSVAKDVYTTAVSDIESARENYAITTLPAVGLATGITSITELGQLGAIGLLSNALSFFDDENVERRRKIKDMDTFYRPDLTFVKYSNSDYDSGFNETMKLMNAIKKEGVPCTILNSAKNRNFTNANAFHIKGEYRSRVYICEEEEVSRMAYTIYSEKTDEGSVAIMRVERWLKGEFKNDVQARSEEFAFKLYREVKTVPQGWGLFYSGHDESAGWGWKNYYTSPNGKVFNFEAPKYADEKMNESRQSQLDKRTEFFKKQNNSVATSSK